MGDGLAHLRIVERRHRVVQQQPVVAAAFERGADEARRRRTVSQSLGGISLEKLIGAGDDGIGERGDVGDQMKFQRIEIRLARLVEVLVRLELHHRARLVGDEFERPAADRLGIEVVARFDKLLRHDR